MSTLEQKPASSEGRKDPWSQLLQKVGKNQDRAAYHALFEHFGPQIKYYAMANGLASHAEELVQEVFVSIWRRSCLYDWRKAAASTWMAAAEGSRGTEQVARTLINPNPLKSS